MSQLTVRLEYTEIASSVMALKNSSKRTIEACDKIIDALDNAKIEEEENGKANRERKEGKGN